VSYCVYLVKMTSAVWARQLAVMVLYFDNREFFHGFASPSILNNAIRTLFRLLRGCGIPGISSYSSSIMSHVLAPSARPLKLGGVLVRSRRILSVLMTPLLRFLLLLLH
jgi:hypothetical protein